MQKYHLGYVYFIQCEAEPKMIKIGWSRKYPDERLSSLQTANPFKLTLIGYMRGCRSDEHAVHFVFKDIRHQGEWFKNTTELSGFIEMYGHSDTGDRSEFFQGMPEPSEFAEPRKSPRKTQPVRTGQSPSKSRCGLKAKPRLYKPITAPDWYVPG